MQTRCARPRRRLEGRRLFGAWQPIPWGVEVAVQRHKRQRWRGDRRVMRNSMLAAEKQFVSPDHGSYHDGLEGKGRTRKSQLRSAVRRGRVVLAVPCSSTAGKLGTTERGLLSVSNIVVVTTSTRGSLSAVGGVVHNNPWRGRQHWSVESMTMGSLQIS